MSYFEKIDVDFLSKHLDSSGRLRISSLNTQLDAKFYNDKQPLLWDEKITGTASAVHLSDSTIDMTVGDNLNDRIVRQSKKYSQYQTGKGLRCLMTGVLNTNPTTGIRTRIGYFDDKNDKTQGILKGNGLFFELDGNSLSVVLRNSDVNLNQTDIKVQQNDWNLDKLDGTGDSNIELDITKAQLFVIDFIWLGVCKIRFGFMFGGDIVYCHEIDNINTLETTFMNTPSLPVRYEIENTDGVTNSCILKQICSSVMNEGGLTDLNVSRSVDRGTNILSAGVTLVPAISIRLKPDYNRNSIDLNSFKASNLSGNRDVRVAIYLNGTVTGGTWENIENSIAQVNTNPTSFDTTGSVLLHSVYLVNDISTMSAIDNQLELYSDIEGVSDTITICFQTTGGSSDVLAGLNFKEVY